ncbi:putative glycolipid-binding domain-containing protein [Thalassospira sp. MA62]|nr:putative glycolipid-binding domain-containing protein [Thalassospira sp. MA62]
MQKNVQWVDWNGNGLEYCLCQSGPDGIELEGVVVGTRQGNYGGSYLVVTDGAFATREVKVAYVGGAKLHVTSDGKGNWSDCITQQDLPALKGCFDIDIGITPATNMLPIRRLNLKKGQAQDISAAYVPLPSQIEGGFVPQSAPQRYTCLIPGERYRYEGLFRGFTAELAIDEYGLVLDYPDTFRRA